LGEGGEEAKGVDSTSDKRWLPMSLKENRVRLLSSCLYLAFVYVLLFWYTSGDSFCERPGIGPGHAIASARLAVACTAWDLFASVCGLLVIAITNKRTPRSGVGIFVSAVVAGVGFCSIPYWIYRSDGRFLFENTWADVSCVFTEGYGMVFPLIVAPALVAGTVVREWLIATNLRARSEK
jgi:hypothetical protein